MSLWVHRTLIVSFCFPSTLRFQPITLHLLTYLCNLEVIVHPPIYSLPVYSHRQINIWNHIALNHLAAPATLARFYYSTRSDFSESLSVFLSADQVLLFNADGGHPGTKSQHSKTAGLAIPANHSRHRDRWNLVPPLLLSLCSSFVLDGHQIQSAECLSFRGAERTAFILLSFWPYIRAVELEWEARQRHY